MTRFPRRPRRRSPKIEIIPMVDVMFLLLVFYVLSSLALTQNRAIPVRLPNAQTGEKSNQPKLVSVSVDRNGDVFLEKEKVDLNGLSAALQTLAAARPTGLDGIRQEGVILNADRSAQMGRAIEVMDRLRQMEITKFHVSTEPAAPTP